MCLLCCAASYLKLEIGLLLQSTLLDDGKHPLSVLVLSVAGPKIGGGRVVDLGPEIAEFRAPVQHDHVHRAVSGQPSASALLAALQACLLGIYSVLTSDVSEPPDKAS